MDPTLDDTGAETETEKGTEVDAGTEIEKNKSTKSEGSTPSFRDLIVKDDYKKIAERFDSMDSFVENYVEKQKYIDSSVRVPKEGASEEEWSKYYKAIGVPESKDQYFSEIPDDTPDDVKDRIGRYADKMFGLKAHPDVVKASYEFLQQEVQGELERRANEEKEAVEKAETEIRKLWKTQEEYDRNLRISKAFISKFGDQELVDYLDSTGLGNNPLMIKFAAKAGSLFSEDFADPVIRGGAVNEADKDALEKEYSERVQKGTERDPEFQRRWGEFFEKTYRDEE